MAERKTENSPAVNDMVSTFFEEKDKSPDRFRDRKRQIGLWVDFGKFQKDLRFLTF